MKWPFPCTLSPAMSSGAALRAYRREESPAEQGDVPKPVCRHQEAGGGGQELIIGNLNTHQVHTWAQLTKAEMDELTLTLLPSFYSSC
jgi:hypothetical protein